MPKYIIHKAVELDAVKKKSVVDPAHIKRWWALQPKYDGCCVIVKLTENGFDIRSRTDEEVYSMDHIGQTLWEAHTDVLSLRGGLVLVGEAYALNTPQSEISGMFRRHANQPALGIRIFDALYGDEFEAGHSPAPYRVRWARIPEGNTALIDRACTVWPSLNGFEPHFIEEFLNDTMAGGGFDGIIFHDPEGTWTAGDGKTGEIIKVKPTVSFDLRILRVIEGKTGKQKGKVGAIVFQWRDGQEMQCIGGSHAELEAWWKDPSLIVGKIGEVEAMCVNQYGQLREPRFKGIRFDKLQPDV